MTSIDVRKRIVKRERNQNIQDFLACMRKVLICLNLLMACYSTENLSFATDTEVSLLFAVKKAVPIPLLSHPDFSTNAIVTVQRSCSGAMPTGKKQLLLLLPFSPHRSNKKLHMTVFTGTEQNRLHTVVPHNEG